MLRRIFIFFVVLLTVDCGALGQGGQTQQPAASAATDAEYRKLDELLSFLRTRNAQDYAISSPKGIDEGSTSLSAESNSGSPFAVRTATILRCSFCTPGRAMSAQSVVFRDFRSLGKGIHGGAVGPAGRGPNAEEERA